MFRHQHQEKFLASFDKLGLRGLPDAVACAGYHYLSNRIGGVPVEYMRESDRKAWVRFVPPRWVYPGAAICGIPSEVSRAMLRGWYAQNGVSLGNPRLGFVCTALTTDGQHGRTRSAEPDRHRRVAAGSADRHDGARGAPHDGVVAGDLDRAIVHQEAINERGKPGRCSLVVVDDGLLREVAAGHHERRHPIAE